jgi:malonyl-CoA/methylmalonyl-CoA synthetase
MCGPDTDVPEALVELRRLDVDLGARERGRLPQESGAEAPAIVIYTSGTTGPPKGAVLPRRAISAKSRRACRRVGLDRAGQGCAPAPALP